MDIYLDKTSRATNGARDSVSTTHKLTVKDGHQVKKLSFFFYKKNITSLISKKYESMHFLLSCAAKI